MSNIKVVIKARSQMEFQEALATLAWGSTAPGVPLTPTQCADAAQVLREYSEEEEEDTGAEPPRYKPQEGNAGVPCPNCRGRGELAFVPLRWSFKCSECSIARGGAPASILAWYVEGYLAREKRHPSRETPAPSEEESMAETLRDLKRAQEMLQEVQQTQAALDAEIPPATATPQQEASEEEPERVYTTDELRQIAEEACSMARRKKIRCPKCRSGVKARVGDNHGPELACSNGNCGWRMLCPPGPGCGSSLLGMIRAIVSPPQVPGATCLASPGEDELGQLKAQGEDIPLVPKLTLDAGLSGLRANLGLRSENPDV